MARTPLASRPLDLLYFSFFLIHIPATCLLDLQAIYPTSIVPTLIAKLPGLYIGMSNDPLIGGAMSSSGANASYLWLKTFMWLELLFQLPVFILGARALWNDSRSIYVLLLAYGASTATTTLPCLAVLFTTPTTTALTLKAGIASLSIEQRLFLLSSYIPFFFVPLVMALDMAFRVSVLVKRGAAAEKNAKRR